MNICAFRKKRWEKKEREEEEVERKKEGGDREEVKGKPAGVRSCVHMSMCFPRRWPRALYFIVHAESASLAQVGCLLE